MTSAELLAELLAAGLDPILAANAVAIAELKLRGRQRFVYGLLLTRNQAVLMRERVTSIEDQFKKQLIDDTAAAAALAALGIPADNANALLAAWAALKTKPTTTGEKLPR
jgi:hypothetical protein